ncbi:MAG: DoxX family membrane protein [Gammaproteobacteria bacterium]|jgi:putative oxidoreductase|nr:DoxX family membrane protein [Gammaproteobacteria bacterium]
MKLFKNDDLGKLILRLVVGVLMLFHGVAKLLNPGSLKYIGSQLAGIGLPQFIAYGVFLGEVVAPLMVILGVYTRIGGLLMAGNMVFAIVLVHTGELFMLTQHGGWALELQGLYLFGALAILFLGSGSMALKRD